MSSRRLYRRELTSSRLISFNVNIKESDIWVAVEESSYHPELQIRVEEYLFKLRNQLENYLRENRELQNSLEPCLVKEDAPAILHKMVSAGNRAGVGPMAAVAGAIAEEIGAYLSNISREIIVENGGDIYLRLLEPVTTGIYAGSSPLSGKLALMVAPDATPLGICTSSGTVGPSLSFGCADAAVVISPSASLADAAATAVGNMVKSAADLENALSFARQIKGVTGAVLICADQVAAWGDVILKNI